jgi:hypothetical protein
MERSKSGDSINRAAVSFIRLYPLNYPLINSLPRNIPRFTFRPEYPQHIAIRVHFDNLD